jgi:hypothetical protein
MGDLILPEGVSRGRKRPALGMSAARPSVLRDAVLPPVLGPVTVTTLTPTGTVKSTARGGGCSA